MPCGGAAPHEPTGTDISDRAEVTFRGRGHAVLCGERLLLIVCPLCSQANPPSAVESGRCGLCAYSPSRDDIEPIDAAPVGQDES